MGQDIHPSLPQQEGLCDDEITLSGSGLVCQLGSDRERFKKLGTAAGQIFEKLVKYNRLGLAEDGGDDSTQTGTSKKRTGAVSATSY